MKIVLLLITFTCTLLALTIPKGEVDISKFDIHYLVTEKNAFSIDAIVDKNFTQMTHSNHTFGMLNNKDIWVKVQLQTEDAAKTIYIQQADTINITDIEFYLLQNHKIISQLKSGLQHDSTTSDAVMKVNLKANSYYVFIAKFSTPLSYVLNMNIYDETHYYNYKKYYNINFAVFMGVIIGLLLYNFYLYFALRYIHYLYYSLFLLSTSIYFMTHTGAMLEFFPIDACYYHYLYYSYFPMGVFFILFLQHILQTKTYMPNVDKIMLLIIFSVMIDFFYYTWFSDIITFQHKTHYVILSVVVLLPLFYFWAIYKKVPLIYLFLLASLPKDIMVFPSEFIFFGWVDFSYFNRYAYGYALLYELIAYSILITYYIKKIQNENSMHKAMLSQKEKQASLGELLVFITHQWRAPLATLSSHLLLQEAKLKNSKPITEEEMMENIQKSQKSIQFMSDTITNFASFYTPDKQKRDFTIFSAIHTIAQIIEKDLLSHNIDLLISGDETLEFYGVENDISQVLLALISNSKAAFIQRGIKNAQIEIIFYRDNSNIVIDIIDNAGGIQITPISKIFEPFSGNKRETYSGIGLYMVRHILASYHSQIDVINTSNGAKFSIILNKESHC